MSDESKKFKEDQEWLDDKIKSRQIVREILNYGVSQTQIYNIIFQLALELEDVDLMKEITGVLSRTEDKEKILIPGEYNE